jgi:hypothetical protein
MSRSGFVLAERDGLIKGLRGPQCKAFPLALAIEAKAPGE